MKAIGAKVSRGLQAGSYIKVVDNTGARKARIVNVLHRKSVRGRRTKAGVGDVVMASVEKGDPEMRHNVVPILIIRQRKKYRRKDGTRVRYEDNAGIVLEDIEKGEPKGTKVKGPISEEAVERYPRVTKISNIVA